MVIMAFWSPKGGVGKSTLTANVGFQFGRRGFKALSIDFDAQNAVRLHFGIAPDDRRGIDGTADRPWVNSVIQTNFGVGLLPTVGNTDHYAGVSGRFGLVAERTRKDPQWFISRLQALGDAGYDVIIADLPPGPNPFLPPLAAMHVVVVTVLTADPLSLALLPGLEILGTRPAPDGTLATAPLYVVNQVDLRHPLSRGVVEIIRTKVGSRLIGTVQHDNNVTEAIAAQLPIELHAPASQAQIDIVQVVDRLAAFAGPRNLRKQA